MANPPAPLKPGPPTLEDTLPRIDHALRNLGDRIELNRNPLTRLAAVADLAESRYRQRLHPRALALRQLVNEAVGDVLAELEGEGRLGRVHGFLRLYAGGSTVAAAGRSLGLSREHCSRSVKRKVLLLVSEKFAQLVFERRRARPDLSPGIVKAS